MNRYTDEHNMAYAAPNETTHQDASPAEAQQGRPERTPPSIVPREDRYWLATEAAETGIWDLNVATDECYFSRYCFATLGEQYLDEMQGELDAMLSLIHPRDARTILRAKLACIDGTAQRLRVEFRAKGRDGQWRWLLCKGKAFSRDASGRARRIIGTVVDITETKRAEQNLRRDHDLLNLITTTSPVGILFTDGGGNVAFVNPRAEQMLGLSRDEIMRRGNDSPICLITTTPGKPERELPLREVLETGHALHACFVVKRPDGERALLTIQTAPFLDAAGEVGGTVAILEDVTEQKQHEQNLADSDRLLRETQRIAQLGSYVLDLRNDSWSCSSKLLEILGIDESYPLNLRGHFDIVHPEYRKRFMASYQSAIKKASQFEMEYKIRRYDDGEERWVAECCELTRDETGSLNRMIGTIQDITERRDAEEAIRTLNEELDRRVIQRTSQLAAAKKEMESFSYSVSHDLRAPLRHINSYSAILVQEHGRKMSPQARDYLERICSASSRMGTLIDDLLRLTQVGKAEMKRELFDISDLAAQVAEMLRGTTPVDRAQFVIQPALSAHGDSTLVRLVMENLLGNSYKYSGQKDEARIEFGETTEDGKAVFFVRDNGVGFDMAYAENMFQPFQRLHGAEFEGTGIGLATVKRIIERHGGNIWAEGKENEGATFYFSLS